MEWDRVQLGCGNCGCVSWFLTHIGRLEHSAVSITQVGSKYVELDFTQYEARIQPIERESRAGTPTFFTVADDHFQAQWLPRSTYLFLATRNVRVAGLVPCDSNEDPSAEYYCSERIIPYCLVPLCTSLVLVIRKVKPKAGIIGHPRISRSSENTF